MIENALEKKLKRDKNRLLSSQILERKCNMKLKVWKWYV